MPVNDSVTQEQWYRFRWCLERGHYQYLEKVHKCDLFFAGDQWSAEDMNKLKGQRRPALTINKILSTMSTIMGEQIYNRNEVTFRPAGEGANSDVADALCKVWMQVANKNLLTHTRSDVFADGIIRSRGFYDVRMDFTENMQGNIVIDLLNSKNVVIDPDAEEYDPDKWNDVFTTKWLTYQDVALLYNKDDAEYLKDKEESLFPYAYDSIEKVRDRFAGPNLLGTYYGIFDSAHVRRNIRVLERQHHQIDNQKHFVDIETGDMRPIPDAWNDERIGQVMQSMNGQLNVIKKKIKRVRWRVTADNCVLHDDWSPYKHFTVVPYFPHFHHGRTIGLVENLIDTQELLNKTSSQELHVINTTANSGWKVKAGNLVNMSIEELEQRGAETGLVAEVKDMDGLEKITPNAFPQGLDRLTYKAEEHLKTISGVSDSMQGFDREDVAAKAIQTKKQSGQANLVKVMDNLDRTDHILARNVLDLIQEFYTTERTIHITHNDMLNQPETINVNTPDPVTGEILNDLTLGEYSIVITSTPERSTLEDSQFEQAKALKELGVQIPDDVLIENSRLHRRSEIIKQMQAAAESPEAQQKKQLENRAMEANVSKLEGEAVEKHAKSSLDQARAQKEGIEAQHLAQGGDTAEMMKAQQEMELERQRLDMEMQAKQMELQFKEKELALKLQFQQEEHAMKMQIAQQEAAQRAQQAEQDAVMKRQQMLQQSEESTEGESQNDLS